MMMGGIEMHQAVSGRLITVDPFLSQISRGCIDVEFLRFLQMSCFEFRTHDENRTFGVV